VSTVVIPILVFQRTGSAAQTGVVTALRVVPYLLVGLIAGPLADRVDRRGLIVWGNLAQGASMAVIPVADAFGAVPLPLIYVASFASATAFVFSDAAVFGALPALIGPARLPTANGYLTSIQSVALMLGPALGGLLATTIGPANAI